MSIINRFLRKINPQNLMAALLILIVIGLLNIAALYASPHPARVQGQQLQTMRRESGPVSYLAALDASLAYGDSRVVDWDQVQWA
jgi:hypothetical protein